MNFSQFIKTKRIAARLSLREFCRLLGIDPSNWSKVERGVIPPPSDAQFLDRISETLSLDWNDKIEMSDLASLAKGQIPPDLQEADVLAKMPAFFRAIRGQEYNESDLQEMISGVRKLHQPNL